MTYAILWFLVGAACYAVGHWMGYRTGHRIGYGEALNNAYKLELNARRAQSRHPKLELVK